ncbi:leucine-rich repeat-containing protein 49 isoform X2 [Ischnura elegans]|uniref:leucine-rich repeat-containing protein 49 isoform X2 n=1 Tax=Ischnura elegans TaxID=197161 RepID=UPI001ED8AD3E|nr:leucine-rich repeat-containing protein 49 isoform X2 [Ischnura elegans]
MRARNKARGNSVSKPSLSVQGKPAGSGDISNDWGFKEINNSVPSLSSFRPPRTPRKLNQRSFSTHSNDSMGPLETVFLNTTVEGKIHATRHQKEKERNPDRISLDKRGITSFPIFLGEGKIKLLSLQHNLINKIEDVVGLKRLVFLDLYNNQIGTTEGLGCLQNLRVLLLGKNRIQQLSDLDDLKKLEVLDLHGNQICELDGLSNLHVLKVLNLASNQIRCIEKSSLQGLHSLKELNLRRNRIKQLSGFEEIADLQKLYVSNNDISSINDMHELATAIHLQELTVDGNPVSLIGDSVYFLVAYLGNLKLLNQMEISDDVKKSAMEWRKNKVPFCKEFSILKIYESADARKQEVICKARTHWKLLRSQAKLLVQKESELLENLPSYSGSLLGESSGENPVALRERPSSVPSSLARNDSEVESDQISALKAKAGDLTRIYDKSSHSVAPFQLHSLPNRRIASAAHKKRQNFSQKSFSHSSENQTTCSSSTQSSLGPLRLPPILAPLINSSESLSKTPVEKSSVNPVAVSKNALQFSLKTPADAFSSNFVHPITTSGLHSKNDYRLTAEQNVDSSLSSLPSDSSSDSSSEEACNGGGTSVSCVEEDECDLPVVNSSNVFEDGKCAIKNSSLASERMKKLSHRSQIRINAGKNRQKISVLPSRTKEQGGDYLIEIDDKCLSIYGQGALRHIDKPWNPAKASEVTSVKFHYIGFNSVALLFGRIKQLFPNVEHFSFRETNIYCLGQINALAEVQGLTSLQIDDEGNPITGKNWRSYAVFRLYHWGLRVINGCEIMDVEVSNSSHEYQGLTDIVLWSLPDALLLPLLGKLHVQGNRSTNGSSWSLSPKEWLWKVADPALRDVVAKEALQWRRANITQEDISWRQKGYNHFGHMLDMACESVEKLKLLEKEWPSILNELIKNTLVDYSQLETYMKKRMMELKLF